MDHIKLYIDEDAMDSDLVWALRSRGVEVLTPLDVGTVGHPDEQQLTFAAQKGLVLYTFNIADFFSLHTQWISAGRNHSGIIMVPQQRFSIGDQLRRLLHLHTSMSPARMRNRVEFLARWG